VEGCHGVPSTIWKGSLSFGLVNVPVEMHTATAEHTVRFHQLEKDTADRVRVKRVNERTGEEVPYSDIVKGYDLGGEYVVITPEELEAVAPERSRAIEIVCFVDLVEIDPVFYRNAYYLAPQGEAAQKAYSLLRRAMEEANKVAIARFVLRNKEYLVAVRPRSDVLVLETMFFADEIREPAGLPAADDSSFSERELATASLLLDSMTKDWEPEEYHDDYQERLLDLIERKRQGEVVTAVAPPPAAAPVVDLMAALQASIDQARDGRSDADADTGGARRRRGKASHTEEAEEAPSPPRRGSGTRATGGTAARRPKSAPKKRAPTKAASAKSKGSDGRSSRRRAS
jgi:DNA end-binding protein Ku